MSNNGKENSPEVYIHPVDGNGAKTFFYDGRIGRIITDFDDDLVRSTVVQFYGPDGDSVEKSVPINKPFEINDEIARECVIGALSKSQEVESQQ